MIHRIDSVNPDIDDRVIKPNQAREALNMRFGASTNDTNMSGGIMVKGNDRLYYPDGSLPPGSMDVPPGRNLVVGVLQDYETQTIYFALYNSEGHHGIYRIYSLTDVITPIVSASWLNFQAGIGADGVLVGQDVSLAVIDNKLYWTDGINPPRMININKALSNQYPANFEEWYYTQIKRPPALPLELYIYENGISYNVPYFAIRDIENWIIPSVDLQARYAKSSQPVTSESGYQFSYYYIYDNYEESRIAPASVVSFFGKNIYLVIPDNEFQFYLKDRTIVKQIVFVYREGNIGAWNVLKTVDNTPANISPAVDYGNEGNTNVNFPERIQYIIEDIFFVGINPVAADIIDADFDAVPLQATCNTIAQNRIFHSNYTIDYPNWDGLTLNLVQKENKLITAPGGLGIGEGVLAYNQRTFMFGRYKIGIELLDEWGRKIGVVGSQIVTIPKPKYNITKVSGGSPNFDPIDVINPAAFNEDSAYWKWFDYSITGTFPSWAKYYRVVYTKCLDYNYFYKTVSVLYYWYDYNGEDVLVNVPIFLTSTSKYTPVPANTLYSENKKVKYSFKGYAVEIISGVPFEFDANAHQYISIAAEYSVDQSGGLAAMQEYKIEKANLNFLYIKAQGQPLLSTYKINPSKEGNAYNFGSDWMYNRANCYYQIYIYSKKTSIDETYYQNTAVKEIIDWSADDFNLNTGTIYGDCWATPFKKDLIGSSSTQLAAYYNGMTAVQIGNDTDSGRAYSTETFTVTGYAFSMNPTDIYSQKWESNIGQINIVNELQKQSTFRNYIAPSSPIILGSEVNGLSKFNSIDAQAMPAENGPITATVLTNATQNQPAVLLAIGRLGIQSIYLGAIQQTASDGTGSVSLSKNVLGSNRPLLGQYGAYRLGSVCVTPLSTVYWWSPVVNDWIRYSTAGLERLGQTYMFGNALRKRFSEDLTPYCVYDQVTDEVMLTGKFGTTFVFSERFKTFQGNREYIDPLSSEPPERGIGLATKFYQFSKGRVWVTTVDAKPNLFFTWRYQPQLTIVTNEHPSAVKQWNQVKLFGPLPHATSFKTETNMNSYINEGWWLSRKSNYEVGVRREQNSVGGIMNGKVMESRILYSTFVFDQSTFDKLNFIEVKSNMSTVQ